MARLLRCEEDEEGIEEAMSSCIEVAMGSLNCDCCFSRFYLYLQRKRNKVPLLNSEEWFTFDCSEWMQLR